MWGRTGEKERAMNHEHTTSRLTGDQIRALMAPTINKNRVKSRKVDGRDQSYVMAWDVKATLIRLFGFGGFSAEVIDSSILQVFRAETHPWHVTQPRNQNEQPKPKTPQVVAQATVRLTVFGIGPGGEDAVYTETAIGANSGWDMGMTMDNAIKTAESDALKRAAIYLGTQFGLSLYENGSRQEVVRVLFNEEQREHLGDLGEAAQDVQNALDRATSQPVTPDDTFEQAEQQQGGEEQWTSNPYE